LNYDLPNFGALHAPQTYFNAWTGTRSGFFTQVPEGIYSIDIFSTPQQNLALFDSGSQQNTLCSYFICLAPNVPIYGSNPTATSPANIVQVVRNFQSPMNHAYNLTVEQALTNKTAVSVAYVGTLGRDLVNWRDLNACPISTTTVKHRQPFGSRFVDSSGNLFNHILQLNNDGYSSTTVSSSLIRREMFTASDSSISRGQSLRHWVRQPRRRLSVERQNPYDVVRTTPLQVSIPVER
jgi:hypothetical protein